MTVTNDPTAISEGLGDRLSENDATILNRVVGINLKVAEAISEARMAMAMRQPARLLRSS